MVASVSSAQYGRRESVFGKLVRLSENSIFGRKTMKIPCFFMFVGYCRDSYSKYMHCKWLCTNAVGPLFWRRPRRRFALSSRVLNKITRGLLLRTQHEVYSSILAEFCSQSHPWTNRAVLFSQPPIICCAGSFY